MKTSNAKTASQKLAATVQSARLRVATAENRWQAAKQQARVAKRRRKEVKIIARHARKQAKQAKADLADARKALAAAEAKLAQSSSRVATGKPSKGRVKVKAKPVARRAFTAPKQKAVPARKRPTVPAAPPPAPEPVAQVTHSIPESQTSNEY